MWRVLPADTLQASHFGEIKDRCCNRETLAFSGDVSLTMDGLFRVVSIHHQGRAVKSMTSNDVTFQSFAHELNSLLDGAMRWIGLADRTASADADPAVQAAMNEQLASAKQALEQMAELIRRGLMTEHEPQDLFHSGRTIERELEHVATLVAPQCMQHRVELVREVDTRIASVPAGILAPVMLNGIRNAVESCSQPGLSCRRVMVSVTLQHARVLELLIEDTGVGLSPGTPGTIIGKTTKEDGHGLGLSLCRSLIRRAGGRLELTNVPYGRGAVLAVMIDPAKLIAPTEAAA